MKHLSLRLFTAWFAGLLCTAVTPPAAMAADDDPPARVARLSYVTGEVSFTPAGSDVWAEAPLNRPLTSGDVLWTADRSRAELQLDTAVLQTDERTGLSFLELSDSAAQLRLTEGTLNLWVRRLNENEVFEVDTPNAAISLLEPGLYRFDVNAETTTVRVRRGRATVSGEQQSFTLDERQQARVSGSGPLLVEFSDIDGQDEFDRWAATRNERVERVASARYVADGVVGYEDLDHYGYWRSDAEFGYIWIPTAISVGWAPYRFGHWAWIAPWGWTWVDDAPWGFAPFHYGRWAYRASRWCWVPGPRHERAVYAPALVAWSGAPGINISVAISSGAVGWLPLGPREVFLPGYRASRNYVRRVNMANAQLPNPAHIDNVFDRRAPDIHYVNRGAPGAFSAVERGAFLRGLPVAAHRLRMDERGVRDASFRPLPPELRPERDGLLGPGRRHSPPPALASKPVIATRLPRAIEPRQGGKSAVNVVARPTPRAGFNDGARRTIPADTNGRAWPTRGSESREPQNGLSASGMPAAPPREVRPQLPDQAERGGSNRAPKQERPTVTSPPASRDHAFTPRRDDQGAEPSQSLRRGSPPNTGPRAEDRSRISPWVQRENRLQQAPRNVIHDAPPQRKPEARNPQNAPPERNTERRGRFAEEARR